MLGGCRFAGGYGRFFADRVDERTPGPLDDFAGHGD